jgi:hypothetical protein
VQWPIGWPVLILALGASLTATLLGNLPEASRDGGVSEAMLQAFIDGGDLPTEIKRALAMVLHNGEATFDPETDLLRSTRVQREPKASVHPPRFVFNPDRDYDAAGIARAAGVTIADISAAAQCAPSSSVSSSWPKRPGFA